MPRLIIDKFTASGNWTCPAGVTAVWATLIGAGTGAHGVLAGTVVQPSGTATGAGGSGAGEVVDSIPMAVIPGTIYPVVVGIGSAGVVDLGNIIAGGNTSFNGKLALGGKVQDLTYPPYAFREAGAGGGGGWGGAPSLYSFGSVAYPANNPPGTVVGSGQGQREHGWRESVNGTGGSRGSIGMSDHTGSDTIANTTIAGCTGGTQAFRSTVTNPYVGGGHGYENYGGGGGGGGTYYGGNDGLGFSPTSQDADPDKYGSGAPGCGHEGNVSYPVGNVGGKGADGLVLIMYTA